MALEGVIAERTRALLPITWDALATDSRFGDDLLLTAIETAKFSVAGEVVVPMAESAYSLFIRDYIAKVAVLNLIPAGIDYWMSTSLTETTHGPDEEVTYADRAETLRKLYDIILREVKDKADEVAAVLGFRFRSAKAVPKLSTIDDVFLTPSPQEFPRPYIETGLS